VTFLGKFFAWMRPTEVDAARLLGGGLALPFVARAPWLSSDLSACGEALPPDAPDAVRPALECEGHAVGYVYVIEGAALGGQLIARHLQATLGISPTSGGRYFAGDLRGIGVRWRAVQGALERYDGAPAATVIEGARRTFDSLLRWLI
jgi:heme oxygenase (biliverdin-IX-beta and delta-forming)